MPKKRKRVISMDEVYPETPRELPLRYWVGSLLRAESIEKDKIRARAKPEAMASAAAGLVGALQAIRRLSFGAPRAEAVMALAEVERFITHPGRYVETAHTIYWDWTMADSCAEEVPAAEMSVADEARAAAAALRHWMPDDPSEGNKGQGESAERNPKAN